MSEAAADNQVGANTIPLELQRIAGLRYGDNPHQEAAVYTLAGDNNPLSLSNIAMVEGDLSASNYFDLDRATMALSRFAASMETNHGAVPLVALGLKHGNACGAAFDNSDPEAATISMIDGDREDIFGGTIALNFPLGREVAEVLRRHGTDRARPLDVIYAPSVTDEAVSILHRKTGKLKLGVNPALGNLGRDSLRPQTLVRSLGGVVIVQENNVFIPNPADETQRMQLLDEPLPPATPLSPGLLFAEAIGSSSTSNTITIVNHAMLVGNGVGQQARHKAAALAVERAINNGHAVEGAVAYSDSFFPQPDGLEIVLDAGVEEVFTMRGSENDRRVIETARQRAARFITVPVEIGRGFLH